MRFLALFLLANLWGATAFAVPQASGFPDRDGDFTGKIALTTPENLQEFMKPEHEGVSLRMLSAVKRGEAIAITPLFTGIEVGKDGKCDVTFDLKLLDPKGKISSGIDEKNIVALRVPIPDRSLVFNSRDIRGVGFEPNDPSGQYTVLITLYDNVAKKKLALKETLTLVD